MCTMTQQTKGKPGTAAAASASVPDAYARITTRIVADLESGVRPWCKPWGGDQLGARITRPRRANGKPYSGINTFFLWLEAVEKGHRSPTWMTYRQAQELGGQVRRTERRSQVVYMGETTKRRQDESTGEEERGIRFLKTYTVFNVGQIDGLPEVFVIPPLTDAPALPAPEPIAHAEAFFAATDAHIRHGGAQAFYHAGADHIGMPPLAAFRDAGSYYATLGHEAVHRTRHPSRLDRSFGRKRWDDEGYAREELVAELGAAFLAADLGLALEPREDHAAYIADWIEVLKGDKRAIFSAAAHAERAVKFLHGLQPGATAEAADPGPEAEPRAAPARRFEAAVQAAFPPPLRSAHADPEPDPLTTLNGWGGEVGSHHGRTAHKRCLREPGEAGTTRNAGRRHPLPPDRALATAARRRPALPRVALAPVATARERRAADQPRCSREPRRSHRRCVHGRAGAALARAGPQQPQSAARDQFDGDHVPRAAQSRAPVRRNR
jgi:antirestriction protein ArdC